MTLFSGPPNELYMSAAALLGGGAFMVAVGVVRLRLNASDQGALNGPPRFARARPYYAAAVGIVGILAGLAFLFSAIAASATQH